MNMQGIQFPDGHPSSYGWISKKMTEVSDQAERDREDMKVTYKNQLQDQIIAKQRELSIYGRTTALAPIFLLFCALLTLQICSCLFHHDIFCSSFVLRFSVLLPYSLYT
jgi:hypothetical protein